MATVAESFVCSLELRASVQLKEWCHKEIFTCRTPGTPQQSDRRSASRALTVPSQLRVSVSQYINSAVQRRAQAQLLLSEVMTQTPLQNQQGSGLWEARKLGLFADILLLFSLSYSDIVILSFQGMVVSDIFASFFCVFIICIFRRSFLWGSLSPY